MVLVDAGVAARAIGAATSAVGVAAGAIRAAAGAIGAAASAIGAAAIEGMSSLVFSLISFSVLSGLI